MLDSKKIKLVQLFSCLEKMHDVDSWKDKLNPELKKINDNPDDYLYSKFDIGSFNDMLGNRIIVSIGVDGKDGDYQIKLLFKAPEYHQKLYDDVLKTAVLFTYDQNEKMMIAKESIEDAIKNSFDLSSYLSQIVSNVFEREQRIKDKMYQGEFDHYIVDGQITTVAEEVIPITKFGEKGTCGDIRVVAKYRCQGNKRYLNFYYNFYHSKFDKTFLSNNMLECIRKMMKVIYDYDPNYKKFGPRD